MFFHIASVERQVDFYKYINYIHLDQDIKRWIINILVFREIYWQLGNVTCSAYPLQYLDTIHSGIFCPYNTNCVFSFSCLRAFFVVLFLPTICSVIFAFFVSLSMSISIVHVLSMVNYCRDWRVTDQVSIEPDCFWTKTGTP